MTLVKSLSMSKRSLGVWKMYMTFNVFIFKDSEKLLSAFKFLTIDTVGTLWYQMTYE